jgi:F-box/TPR repeat protein Pof3
MLDHAEIHFKDYGHTADSASSKEIASAQKGLLDLRVRLDKLTMETAKSTTIPLCHIGKMPVELLVLAFSPIIEYDQVYAAKLSRVCQQWRHICLSIPAFWYSITVDGHKSNFKRNSLWKERSLGAIRELHLRADVEDAHPAYVQSYLGDLQWDKVNTLTSIGGRYEPWSQAHHLISTACGGRLYGNLQSLTLNGGPLSTFVDQMRESEEDPSDPQYCRIRHLRLLRVKDTNSMPLLRHFNDLTTLELEYCYAFFGLASLLQRCPSLRSFALVETSTEEIIFTSEPVLMMSLSEIRVTVTTVTHRLFSGIKAPNLTHLDLIVSAHFQLTPVLMNLANDQGLVHLEELRIDQAAMLDADVIHAILNTTHQLRRLHLTRISSGLKSIVTWLGTPQEGGQLPCPALKHVDFSHSPDLSTSPVKNLVRGRNLPLGSSSAKFSTFNGEALEANGAPLPAAPLKTVLVDDCPLIEVETLPWFRERVREFSCKYMTKKQANYKR